MDFTARESFTSSVYCQNSRNGNPIMAIHRMQGNKVCLSIGISVDGSVVIIYKENDTSFEFEASSRQAREIRNLVSTEYKEKGIDIPPEFILAFTI